MRIKAKFLEHLLQGSWPVTPKSSQSNLIRTSAIYMRRTCTHTYGIKLASLVAVPCCCRWASVKKGVAPSTSSLVGCEPVSSLASITHFDLGLSRVPQGKLLLRGTWPPPHRVVVAKGLSICYRHVVTYCVTTHAMGTTPEREDKGAHWCSFSHDNGELFLLDLTRSPPWPAAPLSFLRGLTAELVTSNALLNSINAD